MLAYNGLGSAACRLNWFPSCPYTVCTAVHSKYLDVLTVWRGPMLADWLDMVVSNVVYNGVARTTFMLTCHHGKGGNPTPNLMLTRTVSIHVHCGLHCLPSKTLKNT